MRDASIVAMIKELTLANKAQSKRSLLLFAQFDFLKSENEAYRKVIDQSTCWDRIRWIWDATRLTRAVDAVQLVIMDHNRRKMEEIAEAGPKIDIYNAGGVKVDNSKDLTPLSGAMGAILLMVMLSGCGGYSQVKYRPTPQRQTIAIQNIPLLSIDGSKVEWHEKPETVVSVLLKYIQALEATIKSINAPKPVVKPVKAVKGKK